MYLKVYYKILLFTFFTPLPKNKTQTLSSLNIVCVGLVLCFGLLGYKFTFNCGDVLILNLILIIVIKKI